MYSAKSLGPNTAHLLRQVHVFGRYRGGAMRVFGFGNVGVRDRARRSRSQYPKTASVTLISRGAGA